MKERKRRKRREKKQALKKKKEAQQNRKSGVSIENENLTINRLIILNVSKFQEPIRPRFIELFCLINICTFLCAHLNIAFKIVQFSPDTGWW